VDRVSALFGSRQRNADWQAGLEQMSLDASLIAFGEFQLGEGGQQSCRRPTLAVSRSVKLCHIAAMVGSRSSCSSSGSRAVSTLMMSLVLSFMPRLPAATARRSWRLTEG
jgi:hypothetical protein